MPASKVAFGGEKSVWPPGRRNVRVHHVGLILRQTLNDDSRQSADGDVAQPQLGLLHQQSQLPHPWIRFDGGPLERGEFERARRRCRRLCRRRAGKQEHEPESDDDGTANGARCTHGRKALRKNGASSWRRRSMNCSNPCLIDPEQRHEQRPRGKREDAEREQVDGELIGRNRVHRPVADAGVDLFREHGPQRVRRARPALRR